MLEGITGAWVDLVAPNVTSLATGIPKKIACATKKIPLLMPQFTGVCAQRLSSRSRRLDRSMPFPS